MKHGYPPSRILVQAMFVVFLLGTISFSSCFRHYYKTNTADSTDAATIQNLVNEKKYFILHTSQQSLALSNITINGDKLEGETDILPAIHKKYLAPKREAGNKFRVGNKAIVAYEVHLYTPASIQGKTHVSVPLKDFYRLDVYGLDKEATSESRVLSIIGITLGTGAIIAAIVSAANAVNNIVVDPFGPSQPSGGSSSGSVCSPQVYSANGVSNGLAGILFSGAIFAPLQRTDYMPLPAMQPGHDTLQLQIRSGQNEELYVQQAKLLQVTHNINEHVLLDRFGKVLIYRAPVTPEKAVIAGSINIQNDLSISDEKYYSFTHALPGEHASSVVLDFKKPLQVNSGKLIIRARNASWGLYVFKKFKSLYGTYYPELLAQKDKADPQKLMQCELDQRLPLLVYVKQGTDWKLVDYFLTPGNVASRDMIMEMKLDDFKDADHLQLKLETTYMFWQLDYAGMDFSEPIPFETSYITAASTLKSGKTIPAPGSNQAPVTLTDQDQLDMHFVLQPATANLTHSYFLAGTGYYHDNTRFTGKAQLDVLAAFSKKDAFDSYSRQTFESLMAMLNKNAGKDVSAK